MNTTLPHPVRSRPVASAHLVPQPGAHPPRVKWAGPWVAAAVLGTLAANASAQLPLGAEYTLTSSSTPITGGYRFDFHVTNVNQALGPKEGLDGFYVSIPKNATISNVVAPPAYYGAPGYWSTSFPPMAGAKAATEEWLQYWGNNPESVYPIGTTANFSYETDSFTSPTIDLLLVTYWDKSAPQVEHVTTNIGMSYTVYATDIPSPDQPTNPPVDPPPVDPPPVTPLNTPEPTTLALLAAGGSALLLRRRRR